MTDVVLGVDSSTQSCTVEVRALATGALISTGRAPHPVTHPPASEQHPDAWWNALVSAVRTALDGVTANVVAVSVGAQCHGLVTADASGRVLRAAKLWNDTTSARQADKLVTRHGGRWWSREIGTVPSAAITLTKLMWVREHEPDVFDAIARLYVPHDWLTYRLTGRHVTDRSDASGTGYFSAHTMRWRTDILDDVLGRRAWLPMLPEVLEPDAPAGRITAEAASDLGISTDAVVAGMTAAMSGSATSPSAMFRRGRVSGPRTPPRPAPLSRRRSTGCRSGRRTPRAPRRRRRGRRPRNVRRYPPRPTR